MIEKLVDLTSDGNFRQKIVTWELEGFEMEATVTIPDDGGHTGVVLVAGSGPTDRDWCSPLIPGTNGSGKLIAEALGNAGYSTIRFDKRASGPHVQENIQKLMGNVSMKGHAEEVGKAVEALLENSPASEGKLYALTNSEGAIHALNHQIGSTRNRFSGLILTGVPGRAVGDVARLQVRAQIASLQNSDRLLEFYDRAISNFENGKPYIPDPSIPQFLDMLLRSVTSPANQPFSLELWKTNPLDLIEKVPEPMLIMIGKKDIQVNWDMDGAILEKNLSGRGNISFSFPENADHVLKYEETPRENILAPTAGQNYNSSSRTLDDQALSAILVWLREH